MKQRDMLLDDIFTSVLSLQLTVYPVDDSCLKSRVCSRDGQSYKHQMTTFHDTFNKDLTRKPIDEKNTKMFITDFLLQFFGSRDDAEEAVVTLMLAYLSRTYIDHFDSIYFKYGLSQMALGWMLFHGVEYNDYYNAIDFSAKRDDARFCIVCRAKKNRYFIEYESELSMKCEAYWTVSPNVYTGGRKPMSVGPVYVHFVLWTKNHGDEFEFPDNDSLPFVTKPNALLKYYWHGKCQYGHTHVHAMCGDIHDSRALEILDSIRNLVRKNCDIDYSEFFHPIDRFFKSCGDIGKRAIVTAILLMRLRLDLDISSGGLIFFCRMAYSDAFREIWETLNENRIL